MKAKIKCFFSFSFIYLWLPSLTWAFEFKTFFGDLTSAGRYTLGEYINFIINFGYSIVGASAALRIILGGFQYIQASGNPNAIATAKEGIRDAVLGMVLVLSAIFVAEIFGGGAFTFWEPHGLGG